jgi:endonuclease YncB( thermonuclease family)
MKARRLILLPFLVFLLASLPSHSQNKFYTVKRVVDGDTLLLTNWERVRVIGTNTPEVHESPKLHRDAERTGRNVKTIIALGRRLPCPQSHQWTARGRIMEVI